MKQTIREMHMTDANGNPAGGMTSAQGLSVQWQDGPVKNGKPNGAFVEGLIQAAIGRIDFYETANSGKFSCVENQRALAHLKDALEALEERTRARVARGVEGSNTP